MLFLLLALAAAQDIQDPVAADRTFPIQGKAAFVGNTTVVVLVSGSMVLLNVDNAKTRTLSVGCDNILWSMPHGPSGQVGLDCKDDRTLRLWSLSEHAEIGSWTVDGPRTWPQFSPSGTFFGIARWVVYATPAGQQVAVSGGKLSGGISPDQWDPSGHILTRQKGGRSVSIDVRTGEVVPTPEASGAGTWSADGRFLATPDGKSLVVTDPTGVELGRFDLQVKARQVLQDISAAAAGQLKASSQSSFRNAAFSPDGTSVFATTNLGLLGQFRVPDLHPIAWFETGTAPYAPSVSPDGKRVAVADVWGGLTVHTAHPIGPTSSP